MQLPTQLLGVVRARVLGQVDEKGAGLACVKALVAGVGIGGLATGIALGRAGLDVEIFERTSELREIGAGLMIWPNGMRSLETLGVEVRTLAVDRITLGDSRGKRLMDPPVEGAMQRYGSNISFVHRADLQAALAKSFGEEGLHLGCDVRGFIDEESRVGVMLRDGVVANGDFLRQGAGDEPGIASHPRQPFGAAGG